MGWLKDWWNKSKENDEQFILREKNFDPHCYFWLSCLWMVLTYMMIIVFAISMCDWVDVRFMILSGVMVLFSLIMMVYNLIQLKICGITK